MKYDGNHQGFMVDSCGQEAQAEFESEEPEVGCRVSGGNVDSKCPELIGGNVD